MGQIGYFGKERFEVSPQKVLTFDGFKRSTAGRYQTSDRIGLKPRTQRVGPGLDTVSFTVTLSDSLGVNPRQILDHWRDLADAGTVDVLVVGKHLVGKNKWLLKSADESFTRLDGLGRIRAATMDLSFEEYVET